MIGDFIAADEEFDGAPLLRTEFALDGGHGPVIGATLRVTALGVVEPYINGILATDDVLLPGWTSYEWRLRVAEYDVTEQVATPARDRVVLAAALGNGWYREKLGFDRKPPYGEELAALIELRVEFEDGHVQLVATDPSWKSGPSETTFNSLYDGQRIDARRAAAGWSNSGFDDSTWAGTHVVEFDKRKLESYVGPGVRRQECISPVDVWTSPTGKVIVDFGQNLVGWVRVTVQGRPGDQITLRHAEVLEHGELGTRPLRSAQATDVFTLSGRVDQFEPTLTFHGFRYVEVDGWPGGADQITAEALTAVVVHSELSRLGSFECSNPLLNQLHRNVIWGMRGNFLDLPTDCPQRDERLGWTGDLAVFAPTAAFLYDVGGFLRDWLRDLAVEQEHQDGFVPWVVPDVLKYMAQPEGSAQRNSTAVWSDAAAWVPWSLWQAYGDREALREALPAMVAHGRRVRGLLSERGVWEDGYQFGDWLDPDAPPERAEQAKADPGVVATASTFRTARIISEVASELDDAAVAEEFARYAEELRDAFHGAYVGNEHIHSDCTTVYALAIAFELLTDQENAWAGRRLAELVVEGGCRISTGFAGTPFIMDALTSTGHLEVAYRLLLQQECPSWLYPVTMGATTIWERWDSMLPDGTINPGAMTSFNHYALGAVADWMHRVMGGIAPLEPGYARVLIAPRPGGDLEWADTSLLTPHGRVEVRWERGDFGFDARIRIPEGVTATFRDLPGAEIELGAGLHELTLTTMEVEGQLGDAALAIAPRRAMEHGGAGMLA
ncbi:family 78 glycoside hydrolase catalytic domain [Microbacterium sp. ISL-59]|uniref:alpha-L-rhamnosidase n=1 Tax=Microbacterium sp. ISL-59 TaxID=2819159 RepID=UPI0027E05BAF|nr:family 78 glycoside hydrolase catalytic domain [Microbacterium sp. ISL-59]